MGTGRLGNTASLSMDRRDVKSTLLIHHVPAGKDIETTDNIGNENNISPQTQILLVLPGDSSTN